MFAVLIIAFVCLPAPHCGLCQPLQDGEPAAKRLRTEAVDPLGTAATVDDILERGLSRPLGPHTAAQDME